MDRKLRVPRIRVVVLIAGLAAIAAGVAWAAIPDGNGVITACVHKSTGQVRVIDTRRLAAGELQVAGDGDQLEPGRPDRPCRAAGSRRQGPRRRQRTDGRQRTDRRQGTHGRQGPRRRKTTGRDRRPAGARVMATASVLPPGYNGPAAGRRRRADKGNGERRDVGDQGRGRQGSSPADQGPPGRRAAGRERVDGRSRSTAPRRRHAAGRGPTGATRASGFVNSRPGCATAAPKLARCFRPCARRSSLIEVAAPDERSWVAGRIADAGLARRPFDPAGVLAAAELIGAEPTARVSERFVTPVHLPDPVLPLLRTAEAIAAEYGKFSVELLASCTGHDAARLRRLLRHVERVHWLDDGTAIAAHTPKLERRVARTTRKVLSIAGSLTLAEVGDALARGEQPVEIPSQVLQGVCESISWLAVDDEQRTVSSKIKLDVRRVFPRPSSCSRRSSRHQARCCRSARSSSSDDRTA